MLKSGRFRTSLVESILIIVSVLLALTAENWRQHRLALSLEEEYLNSIAEGLRRDTAELRSVVDYTRRRDGYTRAILETVVSGQSAADPEWFLIGIEASARFQVADIAREAFDDLLGSGQPNLIRNTGLRRQATAYYQFAEDPAYDLWRSRVWYQFGPVAVDVLPFDVQEWASSMLGDLESPLEAPKPANLVVIAGEVADRLRAVPGAEGLIKAVMRTNANQARSLEIQLGMAANLLVAVEAELAER